MMQRDESKVIEKKCDYCDINLVIVSEKSELIIAKCPCCQCEARLRRVRHENMPAPVPETEVRTSDRRVRGLHNLRAPFRQR